MTIRADLVNEILHQMHQGVRMWKALYVACRETEIFGIYWKALSPDAQLLLIKHIEELIAKEAKTS